MKQQTKTKTANAIIYTGAILLVLLLLVWVVVMTIKAWPVVAIIAGVFGFAFLMSWAFKNTDIEDLKNK